MIFDEPPPPPPPDPKSRWEQYRGEVLVVVIWVLALLLVVATWYGLYLLGRVVSR